MKYINFQVLKLALSVATGIVFAHYLEPSLKILIGALSGLFLLILVLWIVERKKLYQGSLFGIATFILFFLMGATNHQFRSPNEHLTHYIHNQKGAALLTFKITRQLKPNSHAHRFYAELISKDQQKASGRVLLQLKKDSTQSSLGVDELITVFTEIERIPQSLNPTNFHYDEYLRGEGVYGRIRMAHTEILKREPGSTTLVGMASALRSNLIAKLEPTGIQSDHLAILYALVLGDRNHISREMRNEFAAAGAIHLLAVSGLHVGIVYFLLSWLLKPIKILPKGHLVQSLCIVLGLWSFALLAGLSPSVVRAVTMFSCFALALMIDRPTNPLNTLVLSFFVLLVLKPSWLFNVGFQLSYAAVAAILWLQPKIYAWYRPRFLIDRSLWSMASVTLAAQLGVAPLSIYYFNQFPGLFFLTNLVILPFITFLLSGGILVVLLVAIDAAPIFLIQSYDQLLQLLYDFVGWVARQDSFLIEPIYLSLPQMICCYLMLWFIVRWFQYRRTPVVILFLITLLSFVGMDTFQKWKQQDQELIVFHSVAQSIVGIKNHNRINTMVSDEEIQASHFALNGYRLNRKILQHQLQPLPHAWRYNETTFIRIDSSGVLPKVETQNEQVVLLTFNPKIHLDRMINELSPDLVIADGSNYPSNVRRWKKTCNENNIPFHYTGTDGAYIRRSP